MRNGRKRHAFFYYLARWITIPFARLKFGFIGEKAPNVKGPCFILSNHNTDFDIMFVASSFRRPMYYVASEHIFRWGLLSKFIYWAVAPIARVKGSTDGAAAIDILRTLKSGANVCLFAEGNRSFDGRNSLVHPTIGRLVKMAGASLITYRIEGGYFTSPRWSTKLRRGKMRGYCVHVYTPEQLQNMTAEEIYSAISKDIQENAFERQNKQHVRFRGKQLAEQLETTLYICPHCGGVSTLYSKAAQFTCDCGYCLTYDEYGLFSGKNLYFKTIPEWYDWQKKRMREYLIEMPEFVLTDKEVQLKHIIPGQHRAEFTARGGIKMTREIFSIGNFQVKFSELSSLAIVGRNMLVFTANGENFEVTAVFPWSALKYLHMYEILHDMFESKEEIS